MVVALPELAALAALAACMFLVALYYAYGYSLGAVLVLLAAMFRRLSIHIYLVGTVGFGFVGDAIEGLDHAIRRAIGSGIEATRSGWHYFLHVSAYTLREAGAIVEELAGGTVAGLGYLRHVVIQRMILAATHAIWHRIAWVEAQLESLPHRAAAVLEQPLLIIRTRVEHVAAAAVATTQPALGWIGRDLTAIKARLRALEHASTGAIVGVVAGSILAGLGLGWARCSNVARAGRHLCGLDRALLEAFLLGSTVIVSSVSLVELAELLLEVEDELAGAILGGFRETRGATAG